jgi:hypothetical protein
MGSNLQGQVSDLISSMPINNNNPRSSSSGTSGFDQTDAKAPVLSLPPKPMNNMTAGNLFSNPRSRSSSSSHSLPPTMNSSSIFDGNGHLFSGSALMSATALLQKAAQMGATASTASGMNRPLMPNSFVTSLAPPSFGAMQPQMNDRDQPFANQFIQKGGQHEISSQFLNANGMLDNLGMSNMEMLNGLLDQNNSLLMKNMKHDSSNGNISALHGGNSNGGANGATVSRDNMTTVDFLGLGGGARRGNSYEKQQQQKHKEMGFEGIGQRIQGLSHFQQQPFMEKSIWDV